MNAMLDDGVPFWIHAFLKGAYFTPCSTHAGAHKSERNFFCIQCSSPPLCPLCVHKGHSGPGHDVVQIRRSSYHDAVRVNEISRLLDLSNIQVYVINGAKIVFINGRPQARLVKGASYYCETCNRTLLDSVRFCSIGCKLGAMSHDPSLSLCPKHKPVSPLLVARAEDNRAQLRAEGPETSAESSQFSGIVLSASNAAGVKRMRVHAQPSLISEASEDSGDNGSVLSLERRKGEASLVPLGKLFASPAQMAVKAEFSVGDTTPEFYRSRKRKGTPHRSPLF